jgi:hypothetical protein
MEATRNILLVLHFVGLAALFGGFLAQIASPIKNVAAVGVRSSLHNSDPTNWPMSDHAKVGVKTLIIVVILIVGYTSRKKDKDSGNTTAWLTVGLLAFTNIVIAVFWG